ASSSAPSRGSSIRPETPGSRDVVAQRRYLSFAYDRAWKEIGRPGAALQVCKRRLSVSAGRRRPSASGLDSPLTGGSRMGAMDASFAADALIPIGRFARQSGLSIGALRHYDELDLLRPAEIDRFTGYRRYRRGQPQTPPHTP